MGHELIEALDEQPASIETRRKIAYALLKSANLNADLPNRVLDQHEAGFPDRDKTSMLWGEVEQAQFSYDNMRENFAAHLAAELFPEGLLLDGRLAGFFYEWSHALSLPEVEVTEILIRSLTTDGYEF